MLQIIIFIEGDLYLSAMSITIALCEKCTCPFCQIKYSQMKYNVRKFNLDKKILSSQENGQCKRLFHSLNVR